MLENKHILHLSHTDLDGYGAQYVTSYFFDDIEYFNGNYGKEVALMCERLVEIASSRENTAILITDLGLTKEECFSLNSFSRQSGVPVLLIDHHISGEESASLYDWYHLDDSQCASKATLAYMEEHYKPIKPLGNLHRVIEMINSIDIWQEEGYGFEFGKVALDVIMGAKELNKFMFDRYNRELKFKLIEKMEDYLEKPYGVVEFDNDLVRIKKRLLGGDEHKETLNDVVNKKIIAILSANKKSLELVYGAHRGIMTYNIGGISVLANDFLKANPEIDFFIDVSSRGSVSLRANGALDVAALAADAFNGGGHKNASGGRAEGFKDLYFYEDIRKKIQGILSIKAALLAQNTSMGNGIDIRALMKKK